jgi:hypothetical protein
VLRASVLVKVWGNEAIDVPLHQFPKGSFGTRLGVLGKQFSTVRHDSSLLKCRSQQKSDIKLHLPLLKNWQGLGKLWRK